MSSEGENMQIVIRIRPMQLHEKKAGDIPCVSISNDEKEVQVKVGPLDAQTYRVSRCFGIQTNQIEFFNQCGITSLLDSAMNGYRACAFAFGQTGAGKSYTMLGQVAQSKGTHNNKEKHSGLITRSLEYIFHKAAQFENRTTQVKICCLEIYHENVYDLFAEERERTSLNVREFSSNNSNLNVTSNNNLLNSTINPTSEVNFYVEGARMIECKTLEVALAAIEVAIKNRQVGGHELNSRSSRSHCLIEIYIESLTNDGNSTNNNSNTMLKTNKNFLTSHINSNGNIRGKMTLIDLAGSERLKNTNSKGKVLQEAGFINRSLYILGKVIAGLIRTNDYNHRDVPYRDSKLTKLLINSLGGRTRTLLISCLSEGKGSQNETLRTLKFSMSCARIKNRPLKLLDPQEKLINDLKEEVKRLKNENKKLRNNILSSPTSNTISHPLSPGVNPNSNIIESLSARDVTEKSLDRLPPTHSSALLKQKKKKLLQNQNNKKLIQSKSEILTKKEKNSDENNSRIRPQYKSIVYNNISESNNNNNRNINNINNNNNNNSNNSEVCYPNNNVDPDSATELILNINIDGQEFLKKKNKEKKIKKKATGSSPYISHLSSNKSSSIIPNINSNNKSSLLPQLVKGPSVVPSKEKPTKKAINKSVSLPQITSPPINNQSDNNLSILKNKIATGSTKKKNIESSQNNENIENSNNNNVDQNNKRLDNLSPNEHTPTYSPSHSSPSVSPQSKEISSKIIELEKSLRMKRMEMEDNPGEVTTEIEKKFHKLESEAKSIKKELLSLTSDVIPVDEDDYEDDYEDDQYEDKEENDETVLKNFYNNNGNNNDSLWFLNDDDKEEKREKEREKEKKTPEIIEEFDDRDKELELLSQAIKNNTVSFSVTTGENFDPLKGSFKMSNKSESNLVVNSNNISNNVSKINTPHSNTNRNYQNNDDDDEEEEYATDFEVTNDFNKSKARNEIMDNISEGKNNDNSGNIQENDNDNEYEDDDYHDEDHDEDHEDNTVNNTVNNTVDNKVDNIAQNSQNLEIESQDQVFVEETENKESKPLINNKSDDEDDYEDDYGDEDFEN